MAEEYEEASSRLNLLVLVWRVEYDPEHNTIVPSRPVSVVGKDTLINNPELMEIGCRYGWGGYWGRMVGEKPPS